MQSTSYRASDHEQWSAAGLENIAANHEMEYCNQEPDYGDCLSGEWFITDDASKTIIYGTFGNYNSPGASYYTYAEVYDSTEEYIAALAEWESKPEYFK